MFLPWLSVSPSIGKMRRGRHRTFFVKAYRSLADFRGNAKISTWLYTIVYTTSVTFLRKKKMDTSSIDDENTFYTAGKPG
jgi:RNA polymerase sigma-70 factor (ECF subfamily)